VLVAFGTNAIKDSTGLAVEVVKYNPSRTVMVEVASGSSRENTACVVMILVAKGTGTSFTSLAETRGVVVKSGSAGANGASVTWQGQMQMTPEDELLCLFMGCASGEHLEFTVKVRPL
jgi:hypothetical protein